MVLGYIGNVNENSCPMMEKPAASNVTNKYSSTNEYF